MNKKLLIGLLIVVAGIVGLVVAKKAGVFGETKKGKVVEIEDVELSTVTETVAATGKIYPEVEVLISSEVSGEIIELPVREGQAVKKGDLLVKINPDLLLAAVSQTRAGVNTSRAGLEQAKAALVQAEADYNRSKELFDKGIISRADWDASIAAYNRAKASERSAYYQVQSAGATLKTATDNLGRTSIFAPMDGIISKLDAELGERVVGTAQMQGTEIMRVADISNMEVEVDVNENDIVKIAVSDSSLIQVDAYPKREFMGVVTEIANSASGNLTADQVTNFKVKVRVLESSYLDLIENKPESYSPFRPGMTATVDVITNKREDVVAVPISAIVIKSDTTSTKAQTRKSVAASDEQYECVYLFKDGKAKLQVVETGIQDESKIEVRTGLSQGDRIITGPYNTVTKLLKNGDTVREEDEKQEEATEDED